MEEEAAPSLPSDIGPLREALVDWYDDVGRAFPWRETTDPYAILVMEVMSQQTQLERVESAWEAFLDRWPTVEALATADRADVVSFWSDQRLGYNNRARYLHEAARQVDREYDGRIPSSPAELEELPGVGPYTASAVASFAFDVDTAVVDTNVKRVLHRAFDVPDEDDAFTAVAEKLVPPDGSRVWNNAMMELGGTVCAQTPACDDGPCPWRRWCHAYATGDFTAPDVPTQPTFEGSRRQIRGRIIRTLGEYDSLPLDELGPRVRVDYAANGDYGREWLEGILSDLAQDGLVELVETDGKTNARLRSDVNGD